MKNKLLSLDISRQPTDTTCGPTSLHAVYNFFDVHLPLQEVISSIEYLDDGGTLAVMLGIDALKKGFNAEIITFNLRVFDPSWFKEADINLVDKLKQQLKYKTSPKFRQASKAYIQFLSLGGVIHYKTLNKELLEHYLLKNVPILTGLSATYLYNEKREIGDPVYFDDIKGIPSGHFVVLNGIDLKNGTVKILDPLHANPFEKQNYSVNIDHLICAILLGVITYDANLLIIDKKPTCEL
ncbi:peptidase-C39 like family protein [Marivirga sp. S37H4]|uniref:Peptidase-C39 like family protein n=1 Tax=Marivirga aurantiaca TaxID=2802615 RepID=A0A935C8B2_9BACT|nr:peptidase-C39 like family protein [Marivirga aurantiaca]MBK6265405.1 peptidase-C39 like family protein [Marivirga aurantiaca]